MKLAICSQGELFGGVERHILDLCRYWVREGVGEPLVILFHDRTLAAMLRDQGITPAVVRGRHRYDWSLVGQVARLLADRQVEVAHAHGYKATIACGLAARRAGCKVVKTEHGRLEATPARPLAWVKSRSNFRLEQAVTRRLVDHVCYVTEDIARFYAGRHRGLARSTVRNGIDPLRRADYARPPDLPADAFNIGIVGRVTPVKGIPLAVRALARDDVPRDCRLHVIGSGPQEAEVRRTASAAGVADRVHVLGFRANIYDYLAHLDLLLMPSYHEGLPYTLLEAWSLGCPLAVSRVGGLAEVLSPGPATGAVEERRQLRAEVALGQPAGG
ncbi:MAG: glycosyltransferase, partial [Krumholzibacteria bacterium]|nr:glycosyltransferase [Candidatus Krumholzibacteria bacterium]